jgi:hypothetical protein
MLLDPPITKKDIANTYPPPDASLDCSNLVAHLKQRKKDDDSLDYNIHLESEGTLNLVFFVLKAGKEVMGQQGSDTVLLFDTKRGTNLYGHKLGCFCTIDTEDKTRVVAATFLLSEDVESFAWAFKRFEPAFGAPPKLMQLWASYLLYRYL